MSENQTLKELCIQYSDNLAYHDQFEAVSEELIAWHSWNVNLYNLYIYKWHKEVELGHIFGGV